MNLTPLGFKKPEPIDSYTVENDNFNSDLSDSLITLANNNIDTKATTTNYTVTIPSTSWTGASAPFTKVVAVAGILLTDVPIVDIVATGTYATDVTMAENWGLILAIEISSGSITVTATEVPSADIPVILKVVR